MYGNGRIMCDSCIKYRTDHMLYVLCSPLPEKGALTMLVIYSVMGRAQNML